MKVGGTAEMMTILAEDLPRYEKDGWTYLGEGPMLGGWKSIWIRRDFDGTSCLENREAEGK